MKERRVVKQGTYAFPKFKLGDKVIAPDGDETEVDYIVYDSGSHWYYLTNGTVYGEHDLQLI